MNDTELLDLAVSLARRAAAAILAVRRTGFAVERKTDYSPVTEADHVAEALIVEGLRAAVPDLAVVAEEEVAAGHVAKVGERFWLVDPLDGTKEFAAGRDEFAVCIGLVGAGRPLLGAMVLPATGEAYGGLVGRRIAWRQRGDGPREPISARPVPAEGAVVLDSRSHSKPEALRQWLNGKQVAEIRPMGSAMKFVRIAEGAADFAPRLGPTMEWDTAAGQAILEAAGGRVLSADGTPLGYGKPGYLNAGFIAMGGA
jgi:3'(2'), 5'-bisphosphate nucleotidase